MTRQVITMCLAELAFGLPDGGRDPDLTSACGVHHPNQARVRAGCVEDEVTMSHVLVTLRINLMSGSPKAVHL